MASIAALEESMFLQLMRTLSSGTAAVSGRVGGDGGTCHCFLSLCRNEESGAIPRGLWRVGVTSWVAAYRGGTYCHGLGFVLIKTVPAIPQAEWFVVQLSDLIK